MDSTNEIKKVGKKLDIYKEQYYFYRQWFELVRRGIGFKKYFLDNDYKAIAVYGVGEIGQQFLECLSDEDIKIEYVIDKRCLNLASFDHYYPGDRLPETDIIIVTAFPFFDEIYEDLRESGTNNEVKSLKEIVDDIYYEELIKP